MIVPGKTAGGGTLFAFDACRVLTYARDLPLPFPSVEPNREETMGIGVHCNQLARRGPPFSSIETARWNVFCDCTTGSCHRVCSQTRLRFPPGWAVARESYPSHVGRGLILPRVLPITYVLKGRRDLCPAGLSHRGATPHECWMLPRWSAVHGTAPLTVRTAFLMSEDYTLDIRLRDTA